MPAFCNRLNEPRVSKLLEATTYCSLRKRKGRAEFFVLNRRIGCESGRNSVVSADVRAEHKLTSGKLDSWSWRIEPSSLSDRILAARSRRSLSSVLLSETMFVRIHSRKSSSVFPTNRVSDSAMLLSPVRTQIARRSRRRTGSSQVGDERPALVEKAVYLLAQMSIETVIDMPTADGVERKIHRALGALVPLRSGIRMPKQRVKDLYTSGYIRSIERCRMSRYNPQ